MRSVIKMQYSEKKGWQTREKMCTVLHLVTEYAPGGNFFDLKIRDGLLQEEEAKKDFVHTVAAVQHCHSLYIAHPDTNPRTYSEMQNVV